MDINSEANLGESSQSSTFVYMRDSLAVNNPSLNILSPNCALCHRIVSSDNEINDLEAIRICGDCKFLLLEDLETASPDVYPRRTRSSRRRHDSSESIESMFSQQFSQMINLARQNHSTVSEHDGPSVDGDGALRSVHHTSSRTTPSGSRRWRRGLSDNESDGFDSLYGDNESIASFRRHRGINGEADMISYSAYGGDSDASIDGRSFLGYENFGNVNGESDLDSDTDIDPMNAGLYQWNLEDEEEDDSEWEEAEIDGNNVESFRARTQPHGSPISNMSNTYANWRRQSLSPEVEPLRRRERATNFEEVHNYVGDFGDYLDARGFGDLLEHLAETESSRRGAPPASVSFVNNMPRITINDDKLDNTPCAICKDSFTLGTIANQLPCSHFYHPSCILPWLSARNTCPLCRYELPTDDKDYEARKRDVGNQDQTFHIIQPEVTNDDSSLGEPSPLDHDGWQREVVIADSERESGDTPRNRWFFLAAPIVSIVGISLILFLGNRSAGRICQRGRIPLRRENSQRRWWSFF